MQDLGASNTLCGLSILVTVVFELPIFSYSKACLDRVGIQVREPPVVRLSFLMGNNDS